MSTTPRRPARPRFYDGRHYVAGDSVGYLLNQVVLSMRRTIEQRMAVHGLTAAQWYPLWRLKLGHEGTARDLARDTDIDAGAMTRLKALPSLAQVVMSAAKGSLASSPCQARSKTGLNQARQASR